MLSFLKRIFQILRQIDLIVYYLYDRLHHKINERQVLFLSPSRTELNGNFAFIYEAIKDDYKVETALGEIKDRRHLA